MKHLLIRAILAFFGSAIVAWAWCVLIAGRAAPWQATREWVGVFAVAFAIVAPRWWAYWGQITGQGRTPTRTLSAGLWGGGAATIVFAAFIAATYARDDFYGFLLLSSYHMQVLAGAAAITVLIETMLVASASWSDNRIGTAVDAVTGALLKRRGTVALASLAAIGVLESGARALPIGDDLGQYTGVALALLTGSSYPVHQSPDYYVAVGMTLNDPALPAFPILLALGFAALGPTTAGVAVVLAALKAAFPVLLYLACHSLTRNRLVSYVTSVLVTLFPIYQLHVLGAPEPDTLFADLLLVTVVLVTKAVDSGGWKLAMVAGVVAGLVANTRHEGLSFSVAILLVMSVFFRPRRLISALLMGWVLMLLPFAITYVSVAGSLWPSSFAGTVGLNNVQTNLALLGEFALPWYIQATSLSAAELALAGVAAALTIALCASALWSGRRALLFVPALGSGYLFASLLIHPLILNPYSPVDVLRHWSSAIPYVALSVAGGVAACSRFLLNRISARTAFASVLVFVVLAAGVVSYETDRLAHPEWYLGGRWSLLWTGGSYLLADVVRDPIPLPATGDPRTGEQLRAEQVRRLEPYNLRNTNGGEPYHWASLIVALLGLFYSSAPAATRLMESRAGARNRWQPAPQSSG